MPGTMLTVMAGSRILCFSLQTSEAVAVLLLGMWKSLVDFMLLRMYRSPIRPVLEVVHVSLMEYVMLPLSTPRLTCASVRGLACLCVFD